MPLRDMYVVLVSQRAGLSLVEPVEGEGPKETILATLGLEGGYSSGMIEADLPSDATEAWAAWVEGAHPNGTPYFLFRCFPPSLSEEEVEAILKQDGQEPLRLSRSEIHQAKER